MLAGMKKTLALAALLCSAVLARGQATTRPAETGEQRDARMAWFRQARFGMFIHWGLYSVPGGEWGGQNHYGEWLMEEAHVPASEYERLAAKFDPWKFDAKAWVKTARDAGASYIVITTKHHDGFAMFPTKATSWGIQSTPFGGGPNGRDPMKELAAECRAQGIRLCFYHSIMDWHSPDYAPRRKWNDTAQGTPDMDRYEAYLKSELKEILTNYGPVGILWFDGEWEATWNNERGRRIYDYVRSLQPDIIVNNRVAKSRNGMAGMSSGETIGDYGTPEQEIPPTGFPGVDWESCMTMNDHWGFNKADQHWKSSQQLIRNLVECASKGGNFLLNVGPTGEGDIPRASVERMHAIGNWMGFNGESIRGTTASPFTKLKWGRATSKPGLLYLHVYDWPTDGVLNVPMRGKISKAELIGVPGGAITATYGDDGLSLHLPANARPDPASTVIKVTLAGEVEPFVAMPTPDTRGNLTLEADEATLPPGPAKIERRGGHATIGYWTDAAVAPTWKARLDKPGKYSVELVLACETASAGSTVEVACGDARISGKVPDTGGWDSFKGFWLGTVNVAKAGEVTVRVTPTSKPGLAVMNLYRVILRAQ